MKRVKHMLSAADHDRVAKAIGAAEKRTSGEIYCVLAHRSDAYFYPAALMAAAIVLALGFLAAVVLKALWITVDPLTIPAAQIMTFLLIAVLFACYPALRVSLMPWPLRYRRAHDNAQKQFLAHNIHMTQNRTGVLIFVSLAERYVEVVADNEINAKVEQAVWDKTVDILLDHAGRGALAEGFVCAVEQVGEVLTTHFPAGSSNPNEIEDRLTEI